MNDTTGLPYRLGVGIMLLDRRGLVWIGERSDTPGAWQMPQGGIDGAETQEAAARRELKEEIGTNRVRFEAASAQLLTYELPPALVRTLWHGRFRGQKQRWFLCRFEGVEAEIDVAAVPQPEFRAWRWAKPAELPGLAVPFKRALYDRVLSEFAPLLVPAA